MDAITSRDRRIVAEHLGDYMLNTPNKLSSVALERTRLWVDGYTLAEIAEQQAVSTQAVSWSVRGVVKQVKDWLGRDV